MSSLRLRYWDYSVGIYQINFDQVSDAWICMEDMACYLLYGAIGHDLWLTGIVVDTWRQLVREIENYSKFVIWFGHSHDWRYGNLFLKAELLEGADNMTVRHFFVKFSKKPGFRL